MTSSPEAEIPPENLDAISVRVGALYDPALFESVGAELVAMVRAHLEAAARTPAPALPWREPAELLVLASRRLAEAPAQIPSPETGPRARLLGVAADMLRKQNLRR